MSSLSKSSLMNGTSRGQNVQKKNLTGHSLPSTVSVSSWSLSSWSLLMSFLWFRLFFLWAKVSFSFCSDSWSRSKPKRSSNSELVLFVSVSSVVWTSSGSGLTVVEVLSQGRYFLCLLRLRKKDRLDSVSLLALSWGLGCPRTSSMILRIKRNCEREKRRDKILVVRILIWLGLQ